MPEANEDVYRVLGVPPDADAETVKSAYRAIAHANHPDRRPGDAAAAARFDEASRAYSQWQQANGQRPATGQAAGVSNIEDVFSQFQDLFGDFFGGRLGGTPEKGADLRVSLELSEDEAIVGCKRDIEVMRARVCAECAGAGGSGEEITCKDCSGTGKRNAQQGFFVIQTVCPACKGLAKRWDKPCRACERGLARKSEKLAVVVPAGIDHGQLLRLAGKGDELPGKPSGHLFVEIEIEGRPKAGAEPELGRPRDRGDDVVVDAAVGLRHIVFGGSLEVPTPDGSATVKVPRNIEDGHEIRVAGRGKPRATLGVAGDPYRDVARGDLVVVLRVTAAVQRRREMIGFVALASIIIAILVALSR